MRLYDIMHKKEEPVKQNVVEESQLPEIPGYEETAPAETAVVETPAAEEPKYKYTSWWKMPSYAKAEKEYQEQGKKQMEIAEKRAKRQRDLAIFGDLAKLGAQAYAKGGGVYKIDKITPQTEIANEKLRKVRDNNAAQIMAYAERMRTAQQADAANELARNKAEYEYSIADAAAKAKAAKDKRDYRYKVYKDWLDHELNLAKITADAQYKKDYLDEKKTHNAAMRGIAAARVQNNKGKYVAADKDLYARYFDTEAEADAFASEQGTYIQGTKTVQTRPLLDEDGEPVLDENKNPIMVETVTESDKGGYRQMPTKGVKDGTTPKMLNW